MKAPISALLCSALLWALAGCTSEGLSRVRPRDAPNLPGRQGAPPPSARHQDAPPPARTMEGGGHTAPRSAWDSSQRGEAVMRPRAPCDGEIVTCRRSVVCLTQHLLPGAVRRFPRLAPSDVAAEVASAIVETLRGVDRFTNCDGARVFAWKAAYHRLCRSMNKERRSRRVDLPSDLQDRRSGWRIQALDVQDILEVLLPTLSREDRRLLEALLEGRPQAEIIRNLGLATRTFRRRVRDLRERLRTWLARRGIVRHAPGRSRAAPAPCPEPEMETRVLLKEFADLLPRRPAPRDSPQAAMDPADAAENRARRTAPERPIENSGTWEPGSVLIQDGGIGAADRGEEPT